MHCEPEGVERVMSIAGGAPASRARPRGRRCSRATARAARPAPRRQRRCERRQRKIAMFARGSSWPQSYSTDTWEAIALTGAGGRALGLMKKSLGPPDTNSAEAGSNAGGPRRRPQPGLDAGASKASHGGVLDRRVLSVVAPHRRDRHLRRGRAAHGVVGPSGRRRQGMPSSAAGTRPPRAFESAARTAAADTSPPFAGTRSRRRTGCPEHEYR